MMLHQFLSANREALIGRCISKVAQRSEPGANHSASLYGIPLFLDQLTKTLEVEQTSLRPNADAISGPAGGPSEQSELGKSATLHGRELSEHGFTIEQVVHDYGDLCQAITDLASETNEPIDADEFRTLNRCLDNGMADAVTEFSHQRKLISDDREEQAMQHRLGTLAHELRVHINAAAHAVSVIKSGQVGFGGATGAVLDRSLAGMRNVVNRSLAEARLVAGLPATHVPRRAAGPHRRAERLPGSGGVPGQRRRFVHDRPDDFRLGRLDDARLKPRPSLAWPSFH